MKASHYGAVLVRLFAVALLLYGLDRATFMVLIGFEDIEYLNVWQRVVLPLFPIVIAALLWFFPLTVSRFLVRGDFDHTVEPMSADGILVVLLLAIGIFTLYLAMQDTIYWVMILAYSSLHDDSGSSMFSYSSDDISNMVATAFELIVSLFLVFRARYFARLLLRVVR